MVTCKQVSKGSAYKYYGREVVVGDGRRPRRKSLEEAQEEAGVPPGVWMGRALPAVGLVAGARVTEGQMRNLFGEGLHPDADRIVAGRLAAGDSPAAAARAVRLGYRVQKWSGNDLVFRPPGSVQALWALGSPPVRRLVEDIHTRIIGEVLAEAETEHLWVRVGADSLVQRAHPGVIAARFRHYENRDGMPLLHDHVVLSVKVRRQDDRWGTLHTRSFLEYAVALSELYNQRLMEEICRALGLATVPRYPTAGQRPVMELAGIPEKRIDWAATRNKATMQRLAELVGQYQKRTRQPLTTKIRRRMVERASDETRSAKKTSWPLPALRERWRDGAVALVGEEVVDNLLRLARLAAAAIRTTIRTAVDVAAAALEITAIVSVHHGGRFRHRHLLAGLWSVTAFGVAAGDGVRRVVAGPVPLILVQFAECGPDDSWGWVTSAGQRVRERIRVTAPFSRSASPPGAVNRAVHGGPRLPGCSWATATSAHTRTRVPSVRSTVTGPS
ncbi:MobF family relaxase [Streptomyces sp. NPDC005134]|uniref:MobF family relaxase n=1 Tax=Streptomyces sp. NPDC005098 TaxID=3154560 RepID=UPI0033BA4D09